jgi:thiamine-phosphate pyrophosphorylase
VIPALTAIVDVEFAARSGWRTFDLARAFLAGGARLLQLRAKTLAGGEFLELATEVTALAHERGAMVIVNDRVDIARLARADGVHLGHDDLLPAAARVIAGTMLVGLSTHSPEQTAAARREPIDYTAIGPVFRTSTKDTPFATVGVEGVRAAASGLPDRMPLVAIGGITLERVPGVLGAGADSIAVISDLLTGGDPEARVREYIETIDKARAR